MTDPDCRICRAGRTQAQNAAIAYHCYEHGYQEYVPGERIRELEADVRRLRQVLSTIVDECSDPYAWHIAHDALTGTETETP